MTIDEAIAKYKEITNTDAICPAHCNISCDKCVQGSRHLVEWLEELKRRREYDGEIIGSGALRNAYNQGYNKAIDDFVELAKEHYFNHGDKDITECVIGIVEFFAEQLKAGASNGTDNQ